MQKLFKNCGLSGFKIRAKIFPVLFFTTLLSVTAAANVYNVTNTTDGLALNQLRGAILDADALGGTHTINVAAGTYLLTLGEITFGNTAQNITIIGAGPASTIISMSLVLAQRDRIFFINPVGTTDDVITIVQGIKFQNGFLSSDPYGGAGICAGGGLGNALTVTNCIFDNNILPINDFGGAAVCMQVSGDLTVDNCTFTNNISNDADGGAILFIIFNNNPPGYNGDLIVTNSTFTGNSVNFPGVTNSNGGALAFTGQGGIVGTFNVTINNNTFLNNTADGYGGAISANNSPNLSTSQIHFNRFFNNTSATSALSSGLHFVESSGSVNAENNWWGCNTNPVSGSSTAPCNQAGGDVAGGGSLDANPWLQLKTTASPNPICNTPAGLGNTTTVTTSFLNNSDGTAIPVANLSRLIGLPVTWGPTTLGSLSAQQLSIQASGNATATFTSNGTGGAATVNTQVDNVPVADLVARATITVNTLPTVTNPVNITACAGGTAIFTSTITGTPAPLIQWRIGAVVLVNGVQGSGSTVSGQGTNTLTITNVQTGDAATNYNVQASNQCGLATSADATLTVNSVTGGTVGSDQTICSGGDPAAFTESIASTGSGALTYQWQSSTTSCAAGFSNIGGATGTTYDAPAGLAVTTFYRRVTTSTLNAVPCTANSNCITVTVNSVTGGTVAIDQTICSGGDPAAFTQTVASTGTALTYQWQSSTTSCAAGFTDIGGATGTTYDAPAGLTVTTYYRRVTTSTLNAVPCTANSNCITVSVNDVTGGTVGSDQTVCSGGDPALFTQTVASTGSGALTYQWQSSTTSCAAGFSNIGGATGTTYDAPAGITVITYYRRVTTSTLNAVPCTANSNCITVTVNDVTGGTVGSDQTICSGDDPAAFTESVASTGSGALTYQWQSSTTSCAAVFSNIGGATGTTYDAPAGLAVTTYYRRVTTSTFNAVLCTANSNCITVTVNSVTGGTVGSDHSVCPGGDPAAFTQSVASTGGGALTYQWQSSTTNCAAGFTDIGGATSATYDAPAGLAVTTYYRRVTTSTLNAVACTANSNCITVTINPTNTITLTSAPGTDNQSVLINTPITNITYATTGATGATFSGLPTGVNGVWAGNVVTISGSPSVAGLFNYTVTLTGGCGLVTATGSINVSLCGITRTSAAGTDAQSVCINTPITNITYSTTGATGATFSGLPAGVNGVWAANVVTISGTPTAIGIFNYTVTPTGGGCTGAVTATGTITVSLVPNAVATPSSQTVCSAVPITTIVLTGAVPGTVFNWTRDNIVAVTGIAASGSGDISGTLTNTTSAPVTVTFTITPTAGGCAGTSITATVLVNPTPNAVATPSAQTICSGSAITTIVLSGAVSGTVFNWTRDNTVAVTGIAASGAGDISGSLTNTTNAPVTVTFTITPVIGSCTGTPITVTITVASTPSITGVTNDDICEPGGVVNLAAAGNGTINWWNALTNGIVVNTGTTYSPNVTTTTTYYVDATTTSGPQNLLAMPAQSNTFPGNVRGYWFTAPTDFVITSLSVPTTASSGPMSIAVMKFTGNIPPPVFSATTNAFTTVFQTGNNPSLGSVPCNIPVAAGEVIGILGYRGNINSYAPGDYNTSIAGFPVQLQRLGMQFPLSTSPPHDIWREFGPTTSISRVEFEYSAGENCVSAPRVPVTATVFVNPSVNPVADQSVCNGGNVTVNFTGTDPSATYNWTNTNPAIGLPASGSGNLNFTATNATNAQISGTITVTPVNGFCTGTPIIFTIYVASTPSITSVTNDDICEPGGVVNLAAAGNGTINWWNALTGGVVVNTGTTFNPNVTTTTTYYVDATTTSGPQNLLAMPGQSNTFPGNVRGYWFTAPTDFVITSLSVPTTASSGPMSIAVMKFTGNTPPPVFSATTNAFTTVFQTGNNPSLGSVPCNIPVAAGEVIGILGYRGNINSYAPGDYNTSIAGFPVQLQRLGMQFPLSTSPPHDIWREFGPTTSISRVEFEYSAGQNCVSAPRVPVTATVFTLPAPTATPSSQTVCSGPITTIVLASQVPGTTFAWTRDNNVNVTGIAANGTGDISGTLTNNTLVPQTVTFTVTATSPDGCVAPTITATVLVNPTPNAVATPASAQIICSGSAITTIVLTGNVAGTVFNWTRDNTVSVTGIAASGSGNISGSLTNTTNAPVTVTFTITPSFTNAGVTCTGTPITVTVLVNPTPNAVATPSSQTICSGSAITTINLTSSVPGTVFSWTRDNNATVTGIGSSSSGSAFISGSLTNLTNAAVTVTFTITPSYTNAGVTCTGTAITATVVVNPIPNAVATPASQTSCSGSAITTIVLSGNVAGTVYNWTRDNTVSVTGIAASGSGNISGVLTNTTNAPVTVTFTITPSYTNAGVTCSGSPITATVVVNPVPNAVATPASQTICSGSGITTIILTGNVANTVFNWTRDNTVTVTGIPASGTGDIAGVLVNTTNAAVTVTFTITPSYTNAGVTCTGTPITATVVVNPIPNAVATPAAQTICSGSAISTIVLTGNVAGTVYNWTRDNTVAVTGIAASGSGNISGSLTNTTFAPVTVTFTITPSYTNAGVTCSGAPITATVVVNPIPDAVATPSAQTICSGSAITTIVLTGNVTGTVFNWTRNNTVAVTGIAASGSGNISGSLTNTTNAPVTVTFTITPSYTNAGVTCTGAPITATVVVNPIPNAVATPSAQTICSGSTITPIILTGNVTGTVFNWTRNNTVAVTGIAASGSGNISGSLTNTTFAPVTVTFTITPSYTNAGVTCTGVPITATVLVNPTPSAVATPASQTICSGNTITTIVLTGAVAGTTFNWIRNNTVTVTGIAASGSGNISGALTNTTNAPVTVTFTITPTANGCPGPSITATVLVNPTPNAVATPATQTICSGGTITTIVLTGAVAGTTFNWTRDNLATVAGIAASGSGNISGTLTSNVITQVTVTFTITPIANGCPGAPITATVVVNPIPTITCPANIVVNAIAGTCNADVVYPPAVATGVPAPTITYSIPSGSFFPVGVTTVTATASNICGTVSCTFTITVLDVRVPFITTHPVNRTVCVGSSATFSVVATNVASYQWQVLNGIVWNNIAGATASSFTINNTTLSMNNNSYRVALTGPCGTVVFSNPAILVVNPLPLITLSSASNPVLLPNSTVTITATVSPAGGTFVWLFNGNIMPGVTGSSLGPLTVLNVGTYSVIYTDPNGCVSTSLPFIVSAGVSNYLWIYPNPNTGQFNVRFYNVTGETATLKVFNYLGQVVYTQTLVLGVAYSNFLIDLRRHAAGVYIVKIVNGSGAELAAKRLLIYHP